jgi:hypothetical protein
MIMHSTPSTTPMPVTAPAPTGNWLPHAASGESSRNGRARVEQRLDALAGEHLAALAVAGDVLRAAAAVHLRELLVVRGHLGEHRGAVGAVRLAGRVDACREGRARQAPGLVGAARVRCPRRRALLGEGAHALGRFVGLGTATR